MRGSPRAAVLVVFAALSLAALLCARADAVYVPGARNLTIQQDISAAHAGGTGWVGLVAPRGLLPPQW
jgi:hypothetical protein